VKINDFTHTKLKSEEVIIEIQYLERICDEIKKKNSELHKALSDHLLPSVDLTTPCWEVLQKNNEFMRITKPSLLMILSEFFTSLDLVRNTLRSYIFRIINMKKNDQFFISEKEIVSKIIRDVTFVLELGKNLPISIEEEINNMNQGFSK